MLNSVDQKIAYLAALKLKQLLTTEKYAPNYAIRNRIRKILKKDLMIYTKINISYSYGLNSKVFIKAVVKLPSLKSLFAIICLCKGMEV